MSSFEPPLRLLIDTDIGTDDALALLMAFRHPGARVELITTVAGNAPLSDTTRNACFVAELCGSAVPVHAGCAVPLLREPGDARHVHGLDGLGDYGFPAPLRQPGKHHAAIALIEAIRAAPGALTLVTLGPLTNVALALSLDPEIAGLVRRCVVMGGAAGLAGNVTAAAEFNIWADAEAAQIVFRSGLPIAMAGIELCRGAARSTPEEYAPLERRTEPISRFAWQMFTHIGGMGRGRYGWRGEAAIPDAVAMAIALEPALMTGYIDCPVAIETRPGLTYGATILDRRLGAEPAPGSGTIRVALALDVDGYKRLLHRAVGL
ncbi:MAG TPA: nucleoside hydrolase [Dehalococcoidia bacterium]|nr:nucleoside hydrolase [Dehalococcoidia bacterium]